MIAGAWIGGTVDSTGAVVVAGSMVGQEAMEVAAIVKMLQNALIGFVSFAWALYWVAVVQRGEGERVSAREIWIRFPKFVLGFWQLRLSCLSYCCLGWGSKDRWHPQRNYCC